MLSGLCSIPKMVIESTSARFAILSHMSDYQHISHGFEPVFDDRSRILVLGSFPSVQSRKNAFYYGNPQNRFWRVMAACLDEPVPPNEGDPMATTPSPADASAYRDTTTEQILPPTNVNGIHRAATPKWGEASSTKTAAQGEGPANHASLAESIAAKKQLLLAHGIALWDVIESCDIKGSSDASIKNVVPAQVERVLETAHIGAVVCNGGTAGRLYKRYLQWQVGLAAHVLPSTSPANSLNADSAMLPVTPTPANLFAMRRSSAGEGENSTDAAGLWVLGLTGELSAPFVGAGCSELAAGLPSASAVCCTVFAVGESSFMSFCLMVLMVGCLLVAGFVTALA